MKNILCTMMMMTCLYGLEKQAWRCDIFIHPLFGIKWGGVMQERKIF